ncbi:MAG: hypothetical protein WAM73_13800 [Desulfobacterales bacterium]
MVNVSQITGQQVSGPVTNWTVPDGNHIVEHLAGRSPNGDLLVFFWLPAQDWRVVNVTNITGKKIGGPVCSWMSKNGKRIVEHVAGPGGGSELLVFYYQPGQSWKVVDVTEITGVRVDGAPRPCQVTRDGGMDELLVVQGKNGSLHKMWWRSGLDWQAIDLTEALGITFSTPPEVWTTPDANNTVEHIAAADTNGHLIVAWFDSECRKITDDLLDDFLPLSSQRGQKKRVVVILWDPKRPSDPAPSRVAVESAFVGNSNSLKQFFNESSLGRFSFEVVGFLPPKGSGKPDWYPARKPATHYWGPADPNDQDGDGFTSGHTEKWAEAVWTASADFDFGAYDYNKNGTLDPNDLLVCMLIPQNGPAGFQRTPAGQQYPSFKPLQSMGVNSGVKIPTILEIYLGNPPHLGLMFHELAHLFLNAADMYHGWPPESEYVPFTAGPFSLMATGMPANLDPFHRLKYGWLRHRVALRSGKYALQAAVTLGEALVLMDTGHSKKEYFLIENRWNAKDTCDAKLPDKGLAVWHIIEDSAIYNASPTPTGTSASYWNSTTNQWSRRGVRLIRPVVTPPNTNNTQALWDGSDPATGYDVLSVDPNPQHSELRWVGPTPAGIPSGFAICNISPSGPTMTFDLEVPPRKGQIIGAEGRVQMMRVHVHGTGYGPAGNYLNEDCIVRLDTKPGAAFSIDISGANAPAGKRMFDLMRSVYDKQVPVRIEYEAANALDGRVIRVFETK